MKSIEHPPFFPGEIHFWVKSSGILGEIPRHFPQVFGEIPGSFSQDCRATSAQRRVAVRPPRDELRQGAASAPGGHGGAPKTWGKFLPDVGEILWDFHGNPMEILGELGFTTRYSRRL